MAKPSLRIETFDVDGAQDFLPARSLVGRMAKECGLSVVGQTKLVTAASEILTNMIKYAERGRLQAEIIDFGDRPGVRLLFTDRGPGIENIEAAMRDGFTASDSMGLGLPGAKRLVEGFDITSTPGKGTRVEIVHFE